jgi:hypothetical protein
LTGGRAARTIAFMAIDDKLRELVRSFEKMVQSREALRAASLTPTEDQIKEDFHLAVQVSALVISCDDPDVKVKMVELLERDLACCEAFCARWREMPN